MESGLVARYTPPPPLPRSISLGGRGSSQSRGSRVAEMPRARERETTASLLVRIGSTLTRPPLRDNAPGIAYCCLYLRVAA